MGFFTGARIGELCQLYFKDIRSEEGVWFIDINELSSDKSLKNAWSARRVPLHPELEQLGFIRWCERLKQDEFRRVFPELSWNPTNRYAKEPIRAMSQFFEKLGMPRDGTKVIMRKRMIGHEPGEGVPNKGRS